MNRMRMFQIRIAHLLWITLVVAAFLCGRHVGVASKTRSADQEVFSFYLDMTR